MPGLSKQNTKDETGLKLQWKPWMDSPLCLTRVDGFTTKAKLQWKGFAKTLTKTLAHWALHRKMIKSNLPNDLLFSPFKGSMDLSRKI